MAILEVDLEDCQQKLHRTSKELRQSRNETREVLAINKELKAQLSTLAELDQRHSTSSDSDALESANLKVQQLEDCLAEASSRVNSLECMKKEMKATMEAMTMDFQRAEDELLRERDDLERQLFLDAKEFSTVDCQTEVTVDSASYLRDVSASFGSNGGVNFDPINTWTQTDPSEGYCDEGVQIEILKMEDMTAKKKEIETLKQE